MRILLARAPWWVLSIVYGVFLATWTVAYAAITESGVSRSVVVIAAVGAAVFGAIMGPITARQQAKLRALAGDLPLQDLRVVYRAVSRGPVPRDPAVRAAAARLTAHELDLTLQHRTWATVMFAVLAAGSLVFALDSPWWLLSTAVFVSCLVLQRCVPHRLRRRLELLSASPPS